MPAGPYSVQLIDPPFDTDLTFRTVNVTDINDAGQVLGTLADRNGGQAFFYQDGSYTPLAVPDASRTTVTRLNATGEVIGRDTDAAGGHAFLYADGTYSEIAVPGASSTTAVQISDAGQILVQYADDAGQHWAVDDHGTFTTLAVPGASSTTAQAQVLAPSSALPAINDAGEVIGTYTDDAGRHPFLYDGQGGYVTLDVPDALFTFVSGINNAGQVLGSYLVAQGGPVISFVYSDGTDTPIAVPGASGTAASRINDAGQVAGTYVDDTGTHLFVETDGDYVTVPSPFDSGPPAGTPVSIHPLPVSPGSDAQIDPPVIPSPQFTLLQFTNAGDVLARDNGVGGGTFVFSAGASVASGTPTGAGALRIELSYSLRLNDLGQLIGTFIEGGNLRAFLATPQGSDAAANGSAASDPGNAAAAGLVLPPDAGVGAMLGVADRGGLAA